MLSIFQDFRRVIIPIPVLLLLEMILMNLSPIVLEMILSHRRRVTKRRVQMIQEQKANSFDKIY